MPRIPRIKVVAIIPARFASTRFPGKPLVKLSGREMILHVCDRARESGAFHKIIVATDDARIKDVVTGAGFESFISDEPFACGSDRCAWAASLLDDEVTHVVNLQGDEPLIEPSNLVELVQVLSDGHEKMVTLATRIVSEDDLHSPNVVKVVLSGKNHALYFSRSPIPYQSAGKFSATGTTVYRHLGIYGFTRSFLQEFTTLPQSPLSCEESLEQLRALENEHQIFVIPVDSASPGVDTPQDREVVEALLTEWLPSSQK